MTTIATGTETIAGQTDAARPAGADAPKRRLFRVDEGAGQVTNYPDPDPRLTDERVIATLKAQISRLANMAHAWKDEGDTRVCVFTPRPGTKGRGDA